MARYDPFEEMDRMFEQLRTRVWTPEGRFGADFGKHGDVSMDLTKRDDEYVFVADLPGFEREEIDLTFDDGVLTLVAESETSDERTVSETGDERMAGESMADTDEIAIRGQFARSRRVAERVTIPAEVEEDGIFATYRNGVLEVHFPIVESEAGEDGKKIDIAD